MGFFSSRSSSCSDLSSYQGDCSFPCQDPCQPAPQPCPPPVKCQTICRPQFKTVQQQQTCYKTVTVPKMVKTRRVVKVPKTIRCNKIRLVDVQVPTTKKIWQCENVVENKTVKKCLTEPYCRTVMVPKVVTSYRMENRCRQVPVCQPAPVCPPQPACNPCEPVYSNDDCNYCDPCGKPSFLDKIKFYLKR